MSLLGYLMQKAGFSSNGAEASRTEGHPFFSNSELDSIERELIAGNAASRAAAAAYGLSVNPRISAANLR
ncbi:MAG TPA: hypothetical protein VF592_00320 [Sphingomonas sp.]|jgi:hypothetical protein|uniref:hypothetical protein n=1 Tax=Sphingomonas sp. TaxID=28214 RepID=UPI002EDB48F4